MTDLALAARQPGLLATLLRRFLDWMAEEVCTETMPAAPSLGPREWADLPTHHAIRDDRGGR